MFEKIILYLYKKLNSNGALKAALGCINKIGLKHFFVTGDNLRRVMNESQPGDAILISLVSLL